MINFCLLKFIKSAVCPPLEGASLNLPVSKHITHTSKVHFMPKILHR